MFLNHDANDETKRLFDSIVNPVNFGHRAEGRFKIRRMKGNIVLQEVDAVEESGWSKNLLVNTFFNSMFNDMNVRYITGFVCGAGTATPAITDNAMQSYLGGGNAFQSLTGTVVANVAPRHIKGVMRYRGNEGAVVGNVSEVGLYFASATNVAPSNSASLINRARVVDELGNPTSITVLADEFLEVVYELRLYAIEGATGTLTINMPGGPQNFNYEIRPVSMNHGGSWSVGALRGSSGNGVNAHISAWPIVSGSNNSHTYATQQATFGDPESATTPAGFNAANIFTTRVAAAYTPNSRTRLFTIRLPLNNGNFAAPGIRSFNIGLAGQGDYDSWSMHQMLLSGPFQKVAGQIFDLPINVSMGNV